MRGGRPLRAGVSRLNTQQMLEVSGREHSTAMHNIYEEIKDEHAKKRTIRHKETGFSGREKKEF